ncbi:nucleotide-diphospho-sugar transferase [Fimicolochytrium jonesii]|uniref:nucleotide-diphospho-sugar transferase n=1 Tax=Fimicolochytrium jonesii TaxID=1396493 RepID=UPI0022FE7886|nr:nucleotide-diphospho-sugar transferase [Fimicolochytrium jonesii]KAI8825610.1 nucleotide-diphospho-sugar transferase [Fimicolochytrium jonesii]
MAPKGGEQENVLQAVLIADSFNERFQPLTHSRPRCLLPLVNVPLIEYTLECLAISGVQEVFIVCKAKSEEIKKYIGSSRWHNSTQPRVRIVVSQELQSIGDALREVDAKGLIHSDFILVNGDTVANVDLTRALEAHRERREKTDRNAIITMVLKNASIDHRSRARGEESIFIIDSNTQECIHWEASPPYPSKPKIALDVERIGKRTEFSVHSDLIDCQIDICSVDVPPLFTENFDWQDLRADFLKGILESELLGKTVYCHLLDAEYATRVVTPRMYDAVSKDVLSRWVYPIVPENNMLAGGTYKYSRPSIYKEQDVKLDISTNIHERTAIGRSTTFGANTLVRNSVIGANCTIGANVTIENAYIWDNTVVGDGCRLERCIVGYDVTLGEGCRVEMGGIVEGKVVIEAGTVIEADKRVFGDEDNGIAYLEEDEEDDEDVARNIRLGWIGAPTSHDPAADDIDLSYNSDDSDSDSDDDVEETGDWKSEAHATLSRAFTESHSIDIAALELNTLKMAMNISFADLRSVVVPAILSQVDSKQMPGSAKKVLGRWGRLVNKFSFSGEDQAECLEIIEDFVAENPAYIPHTSNLLHIFYELEVLSEDAVLAWWGTLAKKDGLRGRVRDSAKAFVTWLQEAEEEESEEEESESEEEE